MRNLPTLLAVSLRFLATGSALLLISAPPLAHAGTNGTWNTNAGGNWTNTANWSGGIYATGTDANAYFDAIDASSTRIITNSANLTIGNFFGGDTGGTAVSWRLVGAGTITFDTTSGTPMISNSVTVTISNIIAGDDGLLKTGSGILQVGGANVYTGETKIEEGRFRIMTNNVLEDSVIVSFSENANSKFFELDNGAADTIGGLSASGTNGARVVQGVSGSGAAPTLTLNVASGASYSFNGLVRDTASGVSNSIGLSIVKTGSGTQVFSGGTDVGNSGTTTVNGGVLEYAGSTVNNNSAITIGSNGVMRFNTTTSASRTNTITGGGVLEKTGAATLTISNTTHTGGTTIGGGMLTLAAGGNNRLSTNGSVAISNAATLNLGGNSQILKGLTGAGTVTNSAGTLTLDIGSGTNNSFAGSVVGAGGLAKAGSGTVTLTGTNSYSGGTLVSSGALAGSTDGLQGNITNNAAVVFNQTGSGTYSGAMSGGGTLTKQGTGTVTMTGTNTLSGTTTVDEGRLVVNGSNASSAVTVSSNASLAGSGTVGALTVSGLLAPGGSVGTLNAGNTVFNPAGAFELEMYDWAGAAGSGWDLLSITGDLTLSNTTMSPFAINLVSMSSTNAAGLSINFNPNQSFTNTFLTYSGSLLGEAFSAGLFTVNTNNFQNAINGTFSITNVAGGLALLYTTSFLPAADYVWNVGSGAWSTGANWTNGTAPTDGDTIVFSGAGGSSTNNQVTSITGLTFSNTAGSYVISGNAFTNGSGGIVNNSTNAQTISNDITLGASQSASAAAGDLILAGAIDLAGNNLTAASTANTAISGAISGAGQLIKSGAGTLTLSGANSYSGGTTISGGRVIGDTTSLQGAVTNNAALTFDQATNGTFGSDITGTGSLAKTGAGSVTLSGTNTYSGGTLVSGGALIGTTTSLQGDITNDALVSFNQAASGTYAGLMSGTGALAKEGAGTLTLSGANSYSGGTRVSGGELVGSTTSLQGAITNDAAVTFNQTTNGTYAGSMTGTGSLTKAGASTVTLSGANTYSGGTLVSAGAVVGTTASLQGSITNNAAVRFDQATNGVYAGSMSGSGQLSITNTGAVTLSGSNSYAGGTAINAGATVVVANNNALGTGTVTNASGSSLQTDGSPRTLANNFVLTGDVSFGGTGALAIDGTLTLNISSDLTNNVTGGLTLSNLVLGNSAVNRTLVLLGTNNTTFNGTITNSASGNIGSLDIRSTGLTSLNASNGYSGNTIIRGSTNPAITPGPVVRLGHANALGNTTGYTQVNSGGQLDLNGQAVSGEELRINGSGFQEAGALVNTAAGAASWSGVVTLSSSSTFATTNGGITLSGAVGGAGGLTKTGAGTLTLSASNNFTGATTVSGGTLELSSAAGSAAGATASVAVSTNAVLLISQSEQVNNAATVSLSGGTITLSGAVSETFGDLAMNGDSFLNFGGTQGAHFIKFGSLTLNDFTLGISNFVLDNQLQYSAADYAEGEALANTFDFTSSAGRVFSFNDGVFTITAIPEPSAVLAAVGLLCFCIWPVRRRLLACLSGSRAD